MTEPDFLLLSREHLSDLVSGASIEFELGERVLIARADEEALNYYRAFAERAFLEAMPTQGVTAQ